MDWSYKARIDEIHDYTKKNDDFKYLYSEIDHLLQCSDVCYIDTYEDEDQLLADLDSTNSILEILLDQHNTDFKSFTEKYSQYEIAVAYCFCALLLSAITYCRDDKHKPPAGHLKIAWGDSWHNLVISYDTADDWNDIVTIKLPEFQHFEDYTLFNALYVKITNKKMSTFESIRISDLTIRKLEELVVF